MTVVSSVLVCRARKVRVIVANQLILLRQISNIFFILKAHIK